MCVDASRNVFWEVPYCPSTFELEPPDWLRQGLLGAPQQPLSPQSLRFTHGARRRAASVAGPTHRRDEARAGGVIRQLAEMPTARADRSLPRQPPPTLPRCPPPPPGAPALLPLASQRGPCLPAPPAPRPAASRSLNNCSRVWSTATRQQPLGVGVRCAPATTRGAPKSCARVRGDPRHLRGGVHRRLEIAGLVAAVHRPCALGAAAKAPHADRRLLVELERLHQAFMQAVVMCGPADKAAVRLRGGQSYRGGAGRGGVGCREGRGAPSAQRAKQLGPEELDTVKI